jgi:tetratricopeptide (TPR) repeat protein
MKTSCVVAFALFTAIRVVAAPVETKEKKENVDALTAGITAFEAKDYAKAEQRFRTLLKHDLTASTEGKTRFNLGITLKVEKNYDEAVKTFQSILSSHVDDREPGENLMEEFMNYRYRSCLQIASCYAAQSDFKTAMIWAEAARDKHKYEAHCGTCAAQAKQSLDAFLADLQAKARK